MKQLIEAIGLTNQLKNLSSQTRKEMERLQAQADQFRTERDDLAQLLSDLLLEFQSEVFELEDNQITLVRRIEVALGVARVRIILSEEYFDLGEGSIVTGWLEGNDGNNVTVTLDYNDTITSIPLDKIGSLEYVNYDE